MKRYKRKIKKIIRYIPTAFIVCFILLLAGCLNNKADEKIDTSSIKNPVLAHEWDGTSLRIQNSDGSWSWGPYIDLRIPSDYTGDPYDAVFSRIDVLYDTGPGIISISNNSINRIYNKSFTEIGIYGEGEEVGIYGEGEEVGIYGNTNGVFYGWGVIGEAKNYGCGVLAMSEKGPALWAQSDEGYAGDFSGDVQISGVSPEKDTQLLIQANEGKKAILKLYEYTYLKNFGYKWEYNGENEKLILSTDGFEEYPNENIIEIEKNGDVLFNKSVSCDTLYITGGSDISEPFSIKGDEMVKPGMLVSIDNQNIGCLKITDKSYDRCIAGIISGAGGINPGLILEQEELIRGITHPVALSGRVYCWADASNGPIQPGDMLTSSNTLGYAMKVDDYEKAQGAIIGKAMTNLKSGQGLLLVLVSLQ